MEVDSEENH